MLRSRGLEAREFSCGPARTGRPNLHASEGIGQVDQLQLIGCPGFIGSDEGLIQ